MYGFQSVPFILTMLLQFVFAAVNVRAAMRVSGRAFDAGFRVMNLFLVLGKVRGVVKCLSTPRARVFLGLEVNTIHVSIERVLDGKRASTSGPCTNKVLCTRVSREMLL
jgi:hypothetical protein